MDWTFILTNALSTALGPTMIVYAMAAMGVNIHFGYAGLLNLGQAAFVGTGAFGLALMVSTFGMPFWFGIAVGLAGAVVLALLVGIPTLRLRADYLAIVTIAGAEIFRRIFRAASLREWTGGSDGLRGFASPFFALNPYRSRWTLEWPEFLSFLPGLTFGRTQLWVMTVGWTLLLLIMLTIWLAMRSPWGRVLKGIREDEEAVRSLGKNVYSYKMQALVFGGVIGALAGFLIALDRANAQPDTYSTDFTFYLYAIMILGGAARVFGPLVGAAIFWFLVNFMSRTLQDLAQTGILPSAVLDSTQAGPLVFVMVGLGIVLMLIFRPQGIFGDKREITLDVR